MTKQQMTNFIGAGTIAALMLIIALTFGGWNNSKTADAAPSSNNNVAGEAVVMPDSGLQAENAQLKEAVQLLQEREVQFTEQINLANEQLSANSGGYGEEGEAYEEEHEEEYEEYEEEEEDDD
ncbi:MAG: hypothetical protein ACPG8W_16405 [Candidatus Promineifilaceae bacterium]